MLFPVIEASKFVAFQTLLLLVLEMRACIAFARAAEDRGDTDADLRDR